MIDFVFDFLCPDQSQLTHRFWFRQHWIMNLARAMGSTQGIASLFARQLGLSAGTWVLASPICWQATHNDAMLVALAPDNVLIGYFEAFNSFLALDGSSAYQISPELWLFDAGFLGESPFFDLDTVMHQSLHNYLVLMPLSWRRWWTEVQMLFQRLQPQATHGIWPWGGGIWRPTQQVYTNSNQFAVFDFIHPLGEQQSPKNAVVLLDTDDYQKIYRQQQMRLWWQDGYQIKEAASLWQQIKRMVGYAN